jgi:diguanylate cyclase (GGDEF)-like protein
MGSSTMRGKKIYFAAVALLLVAGFLATSLTSYFVAHNALSDHIAEETLPLTSDNIYSEIQRDLLTPILISSLMANDTFVRDWAIGGESDESRIRNYLAEIQKKYGTITAFFVSDRTLNYYHPSGILKRVDADDPADAWYFRVRDKSEPYEVNVDDDTADRSRISIFINFRVTDHGGRYIGVTGVGLSVSAVTRLIETYQRRYGRHIYFVDREGTVTLHGSGFEGEQRLQQRAGLGRLATRILANPSASLSYVDTEGHTVYLNSRLVPEFGWYLLVEQRDGPAERSMQTSLLFNILLSLAITALVMLIAHFTLRSYQRRLEQMATTDKLTGAASRQVFDLIFEHVIKAARRRQRPVAMLNIDIDHFKAINDGFGHQGGDEVIREVAHRIRRSIREADTLCRWGGEEFLVLLDDCALDGAGERAEVIRQAVRAQPVRFGREEIVVTISLGVTQYREGETLEALIRRSDEALYEAKRRGRDRVSRD